jgi:protein TonB
MRGFLVGCCLLMSAVAASAQTTYNRWDARPPAPVVTPARPAATIPAKKDTATTVVLTSAEGKTMTVVCLPVFPGGQQAFNTYVAKRLKKPKGPRQRGTVQVTFTVLASGAVSGAHVKPSNGLSPAYDVALLEVINGLPAFSPGGCNGNKRAMEVTYPYRFE